MERLRKLLQLEKIFNPGREDLQGLEAELDRAQVVASGEAPQDVVTMNSKVRFKVYQRNRDLFSVYLGCQKVS